MAELIDRVEREAELAKKLAKVASSHRVELQLLLMAQDHAQTPEEIDKAEADLREFWSRVEKETRSAVMVPIANAWFAAALLHGMDEGRAIEQSGIHAAAYSATVAKNYTETSKRKVTDSLARAKKERDEEHAKERAALSKKIDAARKQVNRQAELPRGTSHDEVMKELEKLEAKNRTLATGQVLNKQKAQEITIKVFGPNRVTTVAQTEIPRAQSRGSDVAVMSRGQRLIAYWRHSDLRPKGHANALKDPCEICSPLEGKPWWDWPSGMRPGIGHVNCDCFAEYYDPAIGEFLTGSKSPRGLDEWAKRFGITSNPSPLGTLRAESEEWDYVGHLLMEGAADLPSADAITANPDVHQKTKGTYRKGKLLLHGLQIQIETPAGETRSGVAPNGDKWSVVMPWSYGEITSLANSEADGDPVDVFIGPCPESEIAFVVDQNNQEGDFDEHKVMLGFHSMEEARQAYQDSFSPGWSGFRSITPMTIPELVSWIKSKRTDVPVAESIEELLCDRLFEAEEEDDPDGRWVTMHGQHVFIKNGKVTKGPAHLTGKPAPTASEQKAPTVGTVYKIKGQEYVVSGGGYAAKRGPNKGRIPVVMRHKVDTDRIHFAYLDELPGHEKQAEPPSEKAKAHEPVAKPTEKPQAKPKPAKTKAPKKPATSDISKDHWIHTVPTHEPSAADKGDGSFRHELGDKFKQMADEQAKDANEVLGYNGKKPQNFVLTTMNVADIKPSQFGDDYDNSSSRELAKHIGTFGTSDRSKYDNDHSDYKPIAVNEHGEIIDGNHRHAARMIAGKKKIDVLVATGPGDGKVDVYQNHAAKPKAIADKKQKTPSSAATSSNPKVEAWAEKNFNDKKKAANFSKWFGNSKVLDENGHPKVVYHGTQKEFDTFSKDHIGSALDPGDWGAGFYFGSKDQAEAYGRDRSAGYDENGKPLGQKAKLMPVHLSINNPFTIVGNRNHDELSAEHPAVPAMKKMFGSKLIDDAVEQGLDIPSLIRHQIGAKKFTDTLQKHGYDGFHRKFGDHAEEWVAFEPNQIKSATGNRGSFDSSSDSIHESLLEAWDESKHPRDDHGRFVSSGAIHAAAKDPAVAKKLRSEVTDPSQRKKLDAAIDHAKGGGTIEEPPEHKSHLAKALDAAKHAVSAVASIPDKIAGAIDGAADGVINASRKLPGQLGVHDEPGTKAGVEKSEKPAWKPPAERWTQDEMKDPGHWDRSDENDPKWVQSHAALVKAGLNSWKGDPGDMNLAMNDAAQGAPTLPSGNAKQRRAQAEAMMKELQDHSKDAPTLYRGDNKDPAERKNMAIGWTDDPKLAAQWAKRYDGKVYTLNGAHGIQVSDYPGVIDAGEREWIVPAGSGKIAEHGSDGGKPKSETHATNPKVEAWAEKQFGTFGQRPSIL